MYGKKVLTKLLFRKLPLRFLVFIVLLVAALAQSALPQAAKADKEQIVRQIAQNWTEVGIEQYDRGLYRQAEQSFLRAQDYQEYLSFAERETLKELLEKAHVAALERQRDLELIRTVNELVEQNQLAKAKAHLEEVQASQFLTEQDRQLITDQLKKIDNQLNEQKGQIFELYNRSVEFYDKGQFEKAREGFLQIAKSDLSAGSAGRTAEDYLRKIDNILLQQLTGERAIEPKPQSVLETTIKDSPAEVGTELIQQAKPQIFRQPSGTTDAGAAEQITDEQGQLETINRRANILRSYNRAVVNDLVTKAQTYLNRGDFEKAEKTVTKAEQSVNKNRLALGEELFNQYNLQLNQLSEEIAQRQEQTTGQLERQRRLEQMAIEAEQQHREQMEADREKITELMGKTEVELQQQRYKQALEKLQELLVLVEEVVERQAGE